MGTTNIRCIRVLGFLATEVDFGRQIAQERDPKVRSKKASFTPDLRPKHANRISQPKVGATVVV